MRTTLHSGRGYDPHHNDRNFDVSQADHIDPNRIQDNIYRNCFSDPSLTFSDATLKFYQERFGAQLDATNAGYIRNRHPERCKTMEQWMKMKQHSPEETIVQIGNIDHHVSGEVLWECYEDLERRLGTWSAEHGNPFTVVSEALHVDESVPHIHRDRVWHYQDANGRLKLGQEKALEAAGVPLPDPSKAPGRHNNRKMTFDAMVRETWLEILQEHGLQVETEPLPDGRHNRSKEQMIRDKYETMLQDTQDLTREKEHLQAELEPYRDLQIAADEIERSGLNLGFGVLLGREDAQAYKAQATAYQLNRDELEGVRERAAVLDQREKALDDRERDLEQREHRNQNVHRLLEESERKCRAQDRLIASLRSQVSSLQAKMERVEQSLEHQLQTLQGRLRGAFLAIRDVVQATGLLKYDDAADGYQVDELTDKQDRLIEGVAEYGAAVARQAGYEDLAEDIDEHVGLNDTLTPYVEPPAQPQLQVNPMDLDDLEL